MAYKGHFISESETLTSLNISKLKVKFAIKWDCKNNHASNSQLVEPVLPVRAGPNVQTNRPIFR